MKTKQTTIYECDYCGHQYYSLKEVKACEKQCHIWWLRDQRDEILRHHPDDWRVREHCVLCGELLVEYKMISDPIRKEYGWPIFESKDRARLYGSNICKPCKKKNENKIYKKLEKIGWFKQ